MKFEKFEKCLAILCVMCILSFVGYNIKDGFKTYDIKAENSNENAKLISVKVCGEVVNPGTYKVKEKSKVCEVIYAAGGITENASVEDINLDATVTENLTVDVPSDGQPSNYGMPVVNINTANKEMLLLIPGVGETLAERIMKYRSESGGFAKPEDLMGVKGVGKKSFEKMKDYIKTEE